MPTERVIHEYETDDDAVIVERRASGALGTVLGILIVLLILGAVWWFALGPGMAGTSTDINVNLPPPASQPAAS
jgi:hypothetical protein